MRFFTTADSNSEAKIYEVLYALDDDGFENDFEPRFYDDSGTEIAIILVCRDPARNFKQRIRFLKKENCLYVDIMLDLETMCRSNLVIKKRIVGEKMVSELPQIIAKYKFKDFDLPRFSSDLREWFEQNGWIEKARKL